MKLTNNEVLQANGALSRLMELKLPVKVSLDVALVAKLLEGQVQAFGVVRDKLFKTYSITTEQGENGQVLLKSTEEGKEQENLMAFQDEFNELLEAKTEDLNFKKIQLPNTIELEPSILVALTKFVEVD